MAGSSLLLLIDDIASILDDVAVMSKVAAKKTAGVLGDDLALNAEQVSGVRADRELPVVWAVARGSLLNKLILVPAALAISVFAPWAITPLLMIGGAFLCFEGAEKLLHKMLAREGSDASHHQAHLEALAHSPEQLLAVEREKIRGAIRTDFILSAEIIVIALGTVAAAPFVTKVAVLSVVAIGMTIGVYGLVAGIVKLDDAGLALAQRPSAVAQRAGAWILTAAPLLMKTLSVLGTAAMFLVGGGILVHGVPFLHHFADNVASSAGAIAGAVLPVVIDGIVGIVIGAMIVGVISLFKKRSSSNASVA